MITRDITLRSDEIDIDARLYLPTENPVGPFPGLCICHGIPSGQPPDPADGGYPALAEQFCRQRYAVLIFNFRGTGRSGGDIDMPGWVRDLSAAVDYLHQLPDVDGSRLGLMGFSAGAAVSVCLAAIDGRIATVVACACPTEIRFRDTAADIEHYRSIGAIRDAGFPPSVETWADGFGQDSPVNLVDRIAPRPLLLIHGSEDEVVPPSQAYRLYRRAGELKHLVVIDGAGHRLRREARAMGIAGDWLKSVLKP